MNTYKREYDQDMLYDLFINQNMSAQKVANKYNVPRYIIEGDLKKYNIHKPKNLSCVLREKNIDKDKLYQYYIIEKHTIDECAKYFNVQPNTISRKLNKYNIKKSWNESFACLIKNIDKEELYRYYIIENHSTEETAKYFNVHERTIRRRLKKYNIIKSVDKQVECAQKRQIEIYGELFTRSEYYKNNVVQNMVEKGKKTCLEKYGVTNWNLTEDGIKARSCKYLYDNIKFDSSWELALYIYAIDNNEKIEREPVKFEYYVDNILHFYIPDFLYKGELIEIKGNHLINNGELHNVYKKSSYKDVAKQQCIEDNNVKIMQYQDIKFAIMYVKNKYGKNYLKSFKIK